MCQCGAVLVSDVDESGVTTIDGTYIRFQRRTDYVACTSCLRSYRVEDLRRDGSDDADIARSEP